VLVLFVVAAPAWLRAMQIVWRRPAWLVSLTVMLVAVPFRSGAETQGTTHVSAADLGVVLLVGVVAMRFVLRPDPGPLRSWVVLPLGALAVSIVVATLFSASASGAAGGVVRYLEIFVLLPLATYMAIRGPADLELVMKSVLALALFEGAAGVYQFLTNTGASIGGQNVRAVGTFGAYDVIAMSKVVAYGIVVALAWALTKRAPLRRRRLAVLAIAFLTLPLLMALSRGTWLAIGAAVVAVLLVADWRRAVAILVAGGLLLGIAIAVQGRRSVARERIDSVVSTFQSPDPSVRNRYDLWKAAVGMWEDHPLTGVGPKAFPDYKTRYASLAFSDRSDVAGAGSSFQVVQLLTPHSLYLLVLAELGALGLLAFLALVLSLLGATGHAVRAGPSDPRVRAFALFSFGAMIVYSISNIYGDLGGPTTLLEQLIVGCALWSAAHAHRPRPRARVRVEIPAEESVYEPA